MVGMYWDTEANQVKDESGRTTKKQTFRGGQKPLLKVLTAVS